MKIQKQAGVTMLELLVSIALTALLIGAMVFAFSTAMRSQSRLQAAETAFETPYQIQDRITKLLRHAWLNSYSSTILPDVSTTQGGNSGSTSGGTGTTTGGGTGGNTGSQTTSAASTSQLEGQASYFTTQPVEPASGATQSNPPVNTGSGNGWDSQAGSGSQQLVFTAVGLPISSGVLYSSDDFQTLNQTFGPSGGVTEVSFSNQPVGNGSAGSSQSGSSGQGLYIRIQRPGDYDPTQGGMESLLIPNATNISFEFWDGASWDPAWDTTTMTPARLPSAVRVSYTDTSNVQHVFIVPLQLSDVTPTNPVATSTTSSPGGTGQ